MQEHEDREGVAQEQDSPRESDAPESAQRTGHDAVDEVLASVEGLADLPVGEHVEVFDRAHEGLRRALDDAGRDQAPDEG